MSRSKRDGTGNGDSDGPPTKFPRPSSDVGNVILRFLIPARAAGIMIGKGGENIKKIRSQYNVKLNIPDNGGPERIMTVDGDLQAICSIMLDMSPKLKDVMNATLSDPRRITGNSVPRRRPRQRDQDEPQKDDEEEDDSMLDYRILVHESQAGSVIGRGGDRIKELRDRFKMRVIKVYQLLAPYSTDRVVQMVAEPENAVACLKCVIEAVEAAPPRGRREEYDAANFCEADALNYGGWLSRDAVSALQAGIPLQRQNMARMGGYPGGPTFPMLDEMGPMSGGMGSPMDGRGGGRGGRGRGRMSGGLRGMGGPLPVPPPGAPRGVVSNPAGGFGGPGGGMNPMSGYDIGGGYDASMYGAMDQPPSGYGSQSYGGSNPAAGYGVPYGGPQARGMPDTSVAPGSARAGANAPYSGGYGMAPSMQEEGKVSQWYGGWS